MSFLKMGGKAILNQKTTDTLMTLTAGVMNADGTVTASTGYSYTQKFTVKPDDVVKVINKANGAQLGFRRVTCYNGNTAIASLVYENTNQDIVDYIVPEGVDGIVITQGNTARTVRIISGDQYARVIQLNGDGALLETHIWNGKRTKIIDESIRSTSAAGYPQEPFDVTGYAINSMRFTNKLDQPVTINIYDDKVGGGRLKDMDGNYIGFTVPITGNDPMIITADDIPVLNYLNSIRLYCVCATAPTTGTLTVEIVGRR